VQTGDELAEFVVGGHDGQTGAAGYEPAWGFTTTVTGTPTSNVMPVRTDFVINTAANTLSTYHSISDDLVFRVDSLGTISGITDLFVSAGTDGNIELSPDGTGQVLITSAMQVGGDITAVNGSGQDLTLAGDGTGNVNLNSDTVRIGDNNTAATLTTHGTGNLTLSTHSGTNSGTITINQGANANVEISPDGTGQTAIKNLEYNEFIFALGTTSGTIAPNVANGNVQTITLNGNLTLNAFTSPIAGQSVTLIINTNGTGRTLTSSMKFAGGSKTLSTTNTTDIISVFYDGTTYWASLSKDFV
jgi:hypothetical protein